VHVDQKAAALCIVAGIVAFVLLPISGAMEDPKSDANNRTFSSYGELFRILPADEYASLYRDASYKAQGDMLSAADRECPGTLAANFQCDPSAPESVQHPDRSWQKYVD
jgi:hypothetical protein